MSSPAVAEKLQQEVERWRKTLALLEQADTTQVRGPLALPNPKRMHLHHNILQLYQGNHVPVARWPPVPRTADPSLPARYMLTCSPYSQLSDPQGASRTIVHYITEQSAGEPFLGNAENNPWSAAAPGNGGCCQIS